MVYQLISYLARLRVCCSFIFFQIFAPDQRDLSPQCAGYNLRIKIGGSIVKIGIKKFLPHESVFLNLSTGTVSCIPCY